MTQRIFLLNYELRPSGQHPDQDGIGGAYVSAWVRATALEEARQRARAHLQASGWVILDTLSEVAVRAEACPPESRPHLEQAQRDGEVFVIHAFPPQEADA